MGYIVPPPPRKLMSLSTGPDAFVVKACEYCGRRQDSHFNCKSCGAPFPMPEHRQPRKRPTPKVTPRFTLVKG